MISEGEKSQTPRGFELVAMIPMKELEVLDLDKNSSSGEKRTGRGNMRRENRQDLVSV